ncbi:MAG: hypothetical protein LC798_10695 [Chloroflexi bacterium]|nr:hypothetical protein [Chloroflexota bacterium]
MSDATRALNRLAKWRVLLTGWQLGTRPKGDPECDAVSDHREQSLMTSVELATLAVLLIDKGVITRAEWNAQIAVEADRLNAHYEKRFPGVTAHDDGLHMDKRALPWIKGWKP